VIDFPINFTVFLAARRIAAEYSQKSLPEQVFMSLNELSNVESGPMR
jgi:hypothetical protein